MSGSVYKWVLARGWELSVSVSSNFSRSSVFFGEFGKFCKIHEFGEIREIHKLPDICGFRNCCLGTGCAIGRWVVRKIVLCIACFAYSLLLLLFPLLSH